MAEAPWPKGMFESLRGFYEPCKTRILSGLDPGNSFLLDMHQPAGCHYGHQKLPPNGLALPGDGLGDLNRPGFRGGHLV